jgi:hypothetical protein
MESREVVDDENLALVAHTRKGIRNNFPRREASLDAESRMT